MTSYSPQISVIMAVFNAEAYVAEAMESILVQTFTDFEFIIVNDGSTDRTSVVLKRFITDKRIKIINNNENENLANALNKGILAASGKYIARMDADDIAFPERLAKQFHFMEENPEIGVCGTHYQNFGFIDNQPVLPVKDFDIKLRLFYDCPLVHPTIFIRRDLLLSNKVLYNPLFRKNQDYELYSRLFENTKFANLPDILLKYRQKKENLTRTLFGDQRENVISLRKTLFSKLGIVVSENEIDFFTALSYYEYRRNKDFFLCLESLLNKMVNGNRKNNLFPKSDFENHMIFLWENLCLNSTKLGIFVLKKYITSDLRKVRRTNYAVFVKLIAKSFLKI